MTKVSDKILKKIEQEKIEQMPVWRFVLKNIVFWFFWAVALIAGAVSFSAMFFVFSNAGWELHRATHESTTVYLLELLPYFWIISLALMIFAGLYNIRHTKKGYQYSLLLVIVLNVALSLIIGSAFYLAGLGRVADEGVGRRVGFIESIGEMHEEHWVDPYNGLLAGEVTDTFNSDSGSEFMILQAFDESEWIVDITDLSSEEFEIINIGEELKIIGVSDGDSMYACMVMPWNTSKGDLSAVRVGRFLEGERSTKCEDVRPLEALRGLRSN